MNFSNLWNNEYAVLGYGGHLYDELIAFCKLTSIRAIALYKKDGKNFQFTWLIDA
ncbi:MAG: hypothetical protein L3J06_05275 [Cyclobacteriaceae bacterium]|nr:hypothetical protein [Cyclobacteriaceae bacterium]